MQSVVVGGSGFLGGAVAAELVRRGHRVHVLDISGSQSECDERFGSGEVRFVAADILDREALSAEFAGVDSVFHFAGKLGTSELDESPELAAKVNVLGSINVFEAAAERGVAQVFHASKPNVWLNAYTITKHAAEQFGQLYDGAVDGMRVSSLRYFNAYGPCQATGPVRKLVPTFACQALAGRPLEVYGDGRQIVDMLFIDDLAHLTVDYAAAARGSAALDCGRGVPVSVNEVAEAVNEHFASTAGIVHLPMRRGEVPATRLVADPARLLGVVGGHEFADFRTSLGETLDWYATRASDLAADRLVDALA